MSLNWNWNDKKGYVEDERGNRFSLYGGNALLIAIHECKEDNTYCLCWFWADKDHAKNCLGLTKGYDNIHEDNIKVIALDTEYKGTKEIVKLLAQAKIECKIILYNSKKDEIPF